MRYVYLIQSLEDGRFKIGVSKNPEGRIKNLQTGNSSELKVFDKYLTEIPTKIETVLHNGYSHCRKKGEWFEMSLVEAFNFSDECKRIENTLKILKENDNPYL